MPHSNASITLDQQTHLSVLTFNIGGNDISFDFANNKVTALALIFDVILTIEEFTKNIQSFEEWIKILEILVEPLRTTIIGRRRDYEKLNNTAYSDLYLSEIFIVRLEWTKAPPRVIIKARPALDLTWSQFVYFVAFLRHFVDIVIKDIS